MYTPEPHRTCYCSRSQQWRAESIPLVDSERQQLHRGRAVGRAPLCGHLSVERCQWCRRCVVRVVDFHNSTGRVDKWNNRCSSPLRHSWILQSPEPPLQEAGQTNLSLEHGSYFGETIRAFASSAEGTFPSRAPVLDMASFAFAREARYTLVAVFSSAEAISLTSVPEVVSCVGLRCYRQAIPPFAFARMAVEAFGLFFDGGSKSTIRAKPT